MFMGYPIEIVIQEARDSIKTLGSEINIFKTNIDNLKNIVTAYEDLKKTLRTSEDDQFIVQYLNSRILRWNKTIVDDTDKITDCTDKIEQHKKVISILDKR
jgi:hypothetical protein